MIVSSLLELSKGRYGKVFMVTLLFFAADLPSIKPAPSTPLAEIETFNHKLEDATRRMDNAATIALWADDGISFLPSTQPIVGKPSIIAFLDRVTAQIHGARMEKFELKCFAIKVSGDLASEWCEEHQLVMMPGGKPPFDGRGRMLPVLGRSSDSSWRLETGDVESRGGQLRQSVFGFSVCSFVFWVTGLFYMRVFVRSQPD